MLKTLRSVVTIGSLAGALVLVGSAGGCSSDSNNKPTDGGAGASGHDGGGGGTGGGGGAGGGAGTGGGAGGSGGTAGGGGAPSDAAVG